MKLATGPHEFLVRFGIPRKLQGYHIVITTQVSNDDGTPVLKADGSVFSEKISSALTLAAAVEQGLDLKDFGEVMDEVHARALITMDEAIADAAEKGKALEAMTQERDAALAQLKEANDALAAAQAHIAPPPMAAP